MKEIIHHSKRSSASDGQSFWGHAGGTFGFESRAFGSLGGQRILVRCINSVAPEVEPAHNKIIDKEFGR
nr:hypothetical protein [Paenibacillus polymyxa]